MEPRGRTGKNTEHQSGTHQELSHHFSVFRSWMGHSIHLWMRMRCVWWTRVLPFLWVLLWLGPSREESTVKHRKRINKRRKIISYSSSLQVRGQHVLAKSYKFQFFMNRVSQHLAVKQTATPTRLRIWVPVGQQQEVTIVKSVQIYMNQD